MLLKKLRRYFCLDARAGYLLHIYGAAGIIGAYAILLHACSHKPEPAFQALSYYFHTVVNCLSSVCREDIRYR